MAVIIIPLNKQSGKGNMYPDITHTINHVAGACEHKCIYCTTVGNAKPVIQQKYSGEPKLIEHELKTNLGEGNFIFVQNMSDLFAENVNNDIILAVLKHCNKYPKNKYLFQSKNPQRFMPYLTTKCFPPNIVLDTTIETNSYYQQKMSDSTFDVSKAPRPIPRYKAMLQIKNEYPDVIQRVTIEPIMKFALEPFVEMIADIDPEYVYIGADSNLRCKDCDHVFRFRHTKYSTIECPKCNGNWLTNSDGLVEPTGGEIMELIKALLFKDIPIIKKVNLNRMIGKARYESLTH